MADPTDSTLRSTVPFAAAGSTLLDYLAARFRYLDRDGWQVELASGRVLLDGAAARADAVLRAGSRLQWRRPGVEPYAGEQPVVLHQDEALVVVDKPAHLPMHADGPFVHATLVQRLRQSLRAPQLMLVHRLDRETSGVCVLARTAAARADLLRQFAAGGIGKVYHAVVRGRVEADFSVALPIGRARNSRIALRRTTDADAVDPRPATTRFAVVARGPAATLLRCEPTTGRTHQIRVHLESAGHPVLGDKLYGRPDADYLAFVQRVKASGDARQVPPGEPDRQLLHASELCLLHPATGARCVFSAPLPAPFRAWLEVLPA